MPTEVSFGYLKNYFGENILFKCKSKQKQFDYQITSLGYICKRLNFKQLASLKTILIWQQMANPATDADMVR